VVTVGWRLGMAVTGVSADQAMDRGWLLGPFPTEVTWSPDTLRLVGDADWGAVAGAWLPILSIALVAVISLLLYVHALEHVAGTDVDANRELRVAGLAGVLAGAAGGLPGYLYFSNSSLLLRFGGRRRFAAIIAALLPLVVVGFGTTVLGLVPVAVIGGVLLSLGLSFVIEWLWDARVRLGRVDHALVLIIGAAVVIAGFLAAIAIGLVIAIGLFVVRYSRVDVVRRSYTLATESAPLQPQEQRRALAENGDEVRVISARVSLLFTASYSASTVHRRCRPTGAVCGALRPHRDQRDRLVDRDGAATLRSPGRGSPPHSGVCGPPRAVPPRHRAGHRRGADRGARIRRPRHGHPMV
jgi:SulP family sulfate permease